MWGWIGEVLKSFIGPIFEAFRQWRAERTARDLGRAEQGRADAEAGLEQARTANEARGSVGGDDAAVDRMLRAPSARDRT